MIHLKFWSLWIGLFLIGTSPIAHGQSPSLDTEHYQDVANHYANIAFATHSDAHDAALTLQKVIQEFVDAPTDGGLEQAKSTWIASRQPYLQTEVFRFYAGPIDDARGLEPLINGWPLDEFYIDYITGAPRAGIINDPIQFPLITPDLLQRHNEVAGETAITCGYHAIEFLLWGQDLSDTGPGNRPLTDYTQSPSAKRRSDYLKACTELLVRHLGTVRQDWAPHKSTNYRSRFLSENPQRSLWYAVYGIKTFCGKELAGERLLVAWDTRAQEDEHSCFSDTTLQDLRFDAQGILNLWTGRYQSRDQSTLSGPGLETLFRLIDPSLTRQIDRLLRELPNKIANIPAPFDQAILGEDNDAGRQSILACVEHFENLADLLAPFEQHLIAASKSAKRP